MQKRWRVLDCDEEQVQDLQASLRINTAICRLLVQRGGSSFELAKQYFRPSLAELHSPWLMKDMDKAVARLTLALDQQEKILVYGDYDVDGTTSVACMFQFLQSLGANAEFYIPHRYREGYGVSKAGIDYAIDNGVQLIVSLDCGIKSVELVAYAASAGIDFIICDHHLPDETLPAAVAILNAKQQDCPYPFKELCGCGVGLKLMQAMCQQLQLPDEYWHRYLDLVATAIAADIVPMVGENRVLTYFGLQRVNTQPSTGIKALIQLAGLTEQLHVNNLVFAIAPRVNAAGRMDDARKAVELFIEQDEQRAIELARQLQEDNTDRREADSSITEEALALLEQDAANGQRRTTVLYQSHWHKGVVGIVASRLIDKYYRPTIILTNSGEKVSGSARSVLGFNVYEAIHQCKDLLDSYGGHFYAAGLTLKRENVDAFCERFESIVQQTISPASLVPEVTIDTELEFKDINPSFYNIICQMEPFGPENMRPVFVARRVYETGGSRVVKEAHLKFSLKQGAVVMDGIGFGMADKFDLLRPNVAIDVAFTLDENVWQGQRRIQLRVIDIKPSDQPD
ncbi:MAG: single-stranded-DNA-specific exonuclease RecJ [Chitinophagaceae bacterium]|nr:single-stranded-DNA-specific exonuclease RecJ [Chitinophagaceae bacterium]